MTVMDIRTIFTGYVLSILLCVIVMASLWWQNRKRSPEILLWLANYVLQFFALLLITFRGILPDFFTIVVANLFIIGGTVVLYIGLGRYVEKESRQWHNYLMLAVFTLVCLYFTYVYPDIELRTVNQSLALIYICAQCSWLMLRRVGPRLRQAAKATGIVFAAFCLVSMFQIVVNLTIPKTHNIFVSGFLSVVAVLMYQMLFVALTFALFLLVSRRLSMELENELFQRGQEEQIIGLRLSLLEFSVTHSLDELLQKTLDEVGALVESPISFYHFVEEDQKTLSLQAWSTRTLNEFCKAEGKDRHYGIDQAGVWVDCVYQKRAVIHNDYSSLPHRKGMPKGHAPVIRELIVPIMRGGKVMAILGVGNKPRDYTEKDVEKISYLADVAWEITRRKKAEDALRKSEEKFKQLAEVFPETIFEANLKGDVTYANKHGLKHFGLTEEDIAKGVNIFDMVSPRDRNLASERIQTRIKGSNQRYLEYQAMKKDGSTFDALALSVPIIVDGTPVGIRGFVMDITERKQTEEALRESEERISAITNSAKDAIIMMDNNGNISYWNPAAEQILGYASAEAIGKNLHKFIAPERFLPAHLVAFPEFHKNGKGNAIGKTLELAACRKDGREIDIALSLSAVKIEGAWHAVGIMRDITERKQAEEALARLSRQNELILNSSAEGILGLDLQGNHTFVNSTAARMFGYEVAELIGRPGHSTWHHTKPDGSPYPQEECEILAAHLDGAVHRVSTDVFWRKDGTSFPVEYASTPIYEQGRTTGVVVTFADITERKQVEEHIKHLATHDLLTDLPSMRLAIDRLSSALNMARRYKKVVAVMFIDLDGFKTVNDTLGHDAGDYVLKQVAQRLLACVRETDTVARVGGDEFLIIATEINSPDNVVQIAEKVIQIVSQPIIINDQQAVVSTSIGIALFPEHSEDMDKLIKLADEAMYKVKNSGKNNFRFVND